MQTVNFALPIFTELMVQEHSKILTLYKVRTGINLPDNLTSVRTIHPTIFIVQKIFRQDFICNVRKRDSIICEQKRRAIFCIIFSLHGNVTLPLEKHRFIYFKKKSCTELFIFNTKIRF